MKTVVKILISMVVVVALVVIGALIINASLVTPSDKDYTVDYFVDGRFINQPRRAEDSPFKFFSIVYRRITQSREAARPSSPIPVIALTKSDLAKLPDDRVLAIKLGHSTLLLKVFGEYWLVDPMFSNRASPFSFIGPERFHPSPIASEDLPPISRILLTHNHYDHLDEESIRHLATSSTQYYVPLGVKAQLTKWGIGAKQIHEMKWWEESQTPTAKIAFTPAQHFSGRGLTDRNKSLWGSWVIHVNSTRIFISGDSGYFDGFSDIGDKYGPFDVAFVENGAYAPYWPDVHMTPKQTVQAGLDLQSQYLVPVHNSTFDLAFHPWFAPLEGVSAAADKADISLLTPRFGEIVDISDPATFPPWWKSIMAPAYR